MAHCMLIAWCHLSANQPNVVQFVINKCKNESNIYIYIYCLAISIGTPEYSPLKLYCGQAGADLENSGGGVWPIPKRQNVDSLFNHKLILG